ncbi:MAG: transporter substrate-binding domain-containing protein, partial [Synergistaceae bacterium]|nr:transporter substrate-binding domain-containing protein [Synergistaceae bacterium]
MTEKRNVRVGWYDNGSGFNVENKEGAHGYYYEYLQAISQYTNWNYIYVPGTWAECAARLKSGEIDLLGFVNKTPEREREFIYPALPMAVLQGLLVTSVGDDRLTYNDYKKFDGITVGTFKGNAFRKEFEIFCKEHDFKVNYKEFASITDIPKALRDGTIDAAIIAEEDRTDKERIVASFGIQNQFFVTSVGNMELFEELNVAMKQVKQFCPDLNGDLYHKYFSVNSKGKPLFTAEEQEFIKKHPSILVMYDSGWPPIEYLDKKTGKYKGISPDLFRLLGEKCGINFVADNDVSTTGETLSRLAEKEPENQLTTISY